MILTVTPNPALDVTYAVPRLVPGGVHRVRSVTIRAGGKGVNVARVLTALGEATQVVGLGGGPSGAHLVEELETDGLTVSMLDVLPDVRRTLVVDDGEAVTSFWESGVPPVDPEGAAVALLAHVEQRLPTADAITVSGSLPPGLDSALPARIGALALGAGVPAVLDLDGDALRAAALVEGAVLMPNVDELEALTGERAREPGEVATAVRSLVRGARSARTSPLAVVATLGQRGLVAASAAGVVHARLGRQISGNPTGAGDAACAAVARCLARVGSGARLDLRRLAAEATAVSAAAVVCPVAGQIDVTAYRQWLPAVVVEDL